MIAGHRLATGDTLPGRRRLRGVGSALLAGLLVAATGVAGCGGGAGVEPRVLSVIDGDTVVVAGVGKVRYVGIDTPELHHPQRPVQRLAAVARRANAGLVGGRVVRLETDAEVRDAYGRLLAYVWVGSRMINAEMVRRGLARPFPFPPNTRYRGLFARLEAGARRAGRGLWGPAEGGPPWGRP